MLWHKFPFVACILSWLPMCSAHTVTDACLLPIYCNNCLFVAHLLSGHRSLFSITYYYNKIPHKPITLPLNAMSTAVSTCNLLHYLCCYPHFATLVTPRNIRLSDIQKIAGTSIQVTNRNNRWEPKYPKSVIHWVPCDSQSTVRSWYRCIYHMPTSYTFLTVHLILR